VIGNLAIAKRKHGAVHFLGYVATSSFFGRIRLATPGRGGYCEDRVVALTAIDPPAQQAMSWLRARCSWHFDANAKENLMDFRPLKSDERQKLADALRGNVRLPRQVTGVLEILRKLIERGA
jgi:hypothetical protein